MDGSGGIGWQNEKGLWKWWTEVEENFCGHLEMKIINKSLRGTAGLFKTADCVLAAQD